MGISNAETSCESGTRLRSNLLFRPDRRFQIFRDCRYLPYEVFSSLSEVMCSSSGLPGYHRCEARKSCPVCKGVRASSLVLHYSSCHSSQRSSRFSRQRSNFHFKFTIQRCFGLSEPPRCIAVFQCRCNVPNQSSQIIQPSIRRCFRMQDSAYVLPSPQSTTTLGQRAGQHSNRHSFNAIAADHDIE